MLLFFDLILLHFLQREGLDSLLSDILLPALYQNWYSPYIHIIFLHNHLLHLPMPVQAFYIDGQQALGVARLPEIALFVQKRCAGGDLMLHGGVLLLIRLGHYSTPRHCALWFSCRLFCPLFQLMGKVTRRRQSNI